MEIQLKPVLRAANTFLKRFHVIIFVVFVFGGLAVAVFILSSILQSASDTTNSNVTVMSTNFDNKTIERVDQLRTQQEISAPTNLPPGRINPFAE